MVMTGVAVIMLIPIALNAASQNPPPGQAGAKPTQAVPLEVQVVISRYQGEKRVSSLPYILSLKASPPPRPGNGSLRLGARVPIRTQVTTPAADGKPATTTPAVNYENVGTNIDCFATLLEDGRFEVVLTVSESSVITDTAQASNLRGASGMSEYPVLRSYQSTNTLFLKDGQTTQFTAASDRISGEVVRVEVKATVVK
jgi:hypothetical protein